MTITATSPRIAYAGDGVTTSWPVPFIFYSADELAVFSRTGSGAYILLTRGTHYTVAGGNGAAGSITAGPINIGDGLIILRRTDRKQIVNYTNSDPFDADTTETGLDRLVAMLQEDGESLGRAVRAPAGEAALLELPAAAMRAGYVLGFSETGALTLFAYGSDGAGTGVAAGSTFQIPYYPAPGNTVQGSGDLAIGNGVLAIGASGTYDGGIDLWGVDTFITSRGSLIISSDLSGGLLGLATKDVTSGNAGDITVELGNSTVGLGGRFVVVAGSGTIGANVSLQGGVGTAGHGGDVILIPGTGSTVAGNVIFAAPTSDPAVTSALWAGNGGFLRVSGGSGVLTFSELPAEVQNVPVCVPFQGKPTAAARICVPINQTMDLPASLAGTVSPWITNPGTNAAFVASTWHAGTITARGTLTIASTGSLTITNGPTADVRLVPGDMLIADAPAVQDSTLADGGITFMLKKV